MTAKEFYSSLFSLDFMSEEEQQTIFTATELFAYGHCKKQRELCSMALTVDVLTTETHNLVLNAPLSIEKPKEMQV